MPCSIAVVLAPPSVAERNRSCAWHLRGSTAEVDQQVLRRLIHSQVRRCASAVTKLYPESLLGEGPIIEENRAGCAHCMKSFALAAEKSLSGHCVFSPLSITDLFFSRLSRKGRSFSTSRTPTGVRGIGGPLQRTSCCWRSRNEELLRTLRTLHLRDRTMNATSDGLPSIDFASVTKKCL